jgi:hypothetical protein
MASNTKYKPSNKSQFSADDMTTDFKGIRFDVNVNTITDCDYQITDDSILDGMIVDSINHVLGDKVTFQVIDKDNILGYGANVILRQFGTDIYMTPGIVRQVDHSSEYPAKIFTGLYLRIKYTSTDISVAPTILVRYKLHKILW